MKLLKQRLFIIFSLTMLLGLFIMSYFLYLGGRAQTLNILAEEEHQAAYQFFVAKQKLSQLELAHNHFEITHSPDDLVVFNAAANSLEWSLRLIATTSDLDEADSQALNAFQQELDAYYSLFEQIEQAVNAEDTERLLALDDQAYEIIPVLYIHLDEIIRRRSERLDEISFETGLYQLQVLLVAGVGLLIFLALSTISLVLIHGQINVPLRRLAEATAAIEAGRFQPATLQSIAARTDEIGEMSNELLRTAEHLATRQATLEQQAQEIRGKIK